MLKVLGAGPNSELARTLDKFTDQRERLKKQLGDFISWKNKYPSNGSIPNLMPGFGDNDKKFISGAKFDNRIPGISHAHLTHNISVVYQIDRDTNTLKLYGLYSHDDIGTGSPANKNRQEQAAIRFSNMKFDASQDPIALQPDKKQKQQVTKTVGNIDYTPKPKVVPQKAKVVPQTSVEPDRTLQFANELEKLWPQRNIFNRLKQAKTNQEKIGILTSELAYMDLIRYRHALYPNQQKYLQGIDVLFRYVSTLKR